MITELRRKLDSGEISAPELTKSYLARINEINGELNSYITVSADLATEQAIKAQKLIEAKKSTFMTGIPISIKDNICTKGIKTTCASKMLENFIPFYNASAVEKLINENAVILGKTNHDEFAMGSTNETSYFGAVKNPHNLSYIPGGSSGGAAASVAANLCTAALGSDTGGSVRQPASFCGVTGFKPTYGTISRYGLIAFASSMDQIGVITQSVSDAAHIMNIISGNDTHDSTVSSQACNNFTSMLGSSLKGLRIGIPKEFFSHDITDDVRKQVMTAAEFYKSNGSVLIDVSLKSLDLAPEIYRVISSAEASSNLGRYDGIKYGHNSNSDDNFEISVSDSRNEGFGEEVKKRILFGTFVLSEENYETYYKKALQLREQIKSEYKEIFEHCDMIITPTTPSGAYKFSNQTAKMIHKYTADKCTITANLAGLPAITTPCGYDNNNMPLGMSLVGRPFDDSRIMFAADIFERNFKKNTNTY